MARIDDNKVKMKATERVQMRERTVEMEVSRMPYTMIMKMVEAKEKETLLRYLYIPLLVGLDGVLIYLAVLLAWFGAWYLFFGFAFFAGLSSYGVWTSIEQSRKTREQLSEYSRPRLMEQSAEIEIARGEKKQD